MSVPGYRAAHDFDPPLDVAADVYRRRIVVSEPDQSPDVSICDLEDDFHHFVVTVRHDGHAVVDIAAEAERWPWATCPAAADSLRGLIGMPLSARFTATGKYADPHWNCTHQFDAASLAITHAAGRAAATRGPTRQYDAEVVTPAEVAARGVGTNRLWVDGALALEWKLAFMGGIVDAEPPFDAAPWKGGFMRWADATLDPETAERAIVMRRVCDIGRGRGMALDDMPVASDLLPIQRGVCYTMQPEIAVVGHRHVGSIRDFAQHPDDLCRDLTHPS